MNMNNSIFTTPDIETRRKLALAKIYRLLLRLAEEAEKASISSDSQATEEKAENVTEES
jgi:hypothetical protein